MAVATPMVIQSLLALASLGLGLVAVREIRRLAGDPLPVDPDPPPWRVPEGQAFLLVGSLIVGAALGQAVIGLAAAQAFTLAATVALTYLGVRIAGDREAAGDRWVRLLYGPDGLHMPEVRRHTRAIGVGAALLGAAGVVATLFGLLTA